MSKKEIAVIDMSAHMGEGLENVTKDDLSFPFLKLLQSTSPEVTAEDSNAKAGEFLNSVTMENYGREVKVILCSYKHQYNHWRERSQGGGFLGAYTSADPIVAQAKKNMIEKGLKGAQEYLPDGTYLMSTANFAVIAVNKEGKASPALLAAASTQLAPARKLLTAASQFLNAEGKPYPLFARTYILSTERKTNDSGSWYVLKFSIGEMIQDKALFDLAVNLSKSFAAYEVKGQEETEEFEG